MILPRLSSNGTIIWYLRGILTQRLKNCGKNHYRIKDLAPLRIWIESHFKVSYVIYLHILNKNNPEIMVILK